jgi:uncharacterized short protein YbdD (DUF466 family)
MEKFKKATPYLLIALLVTWFCYKFFVERKMPAEQKMTLDWDQLDSTSGSAPLPVPASIKPKTKSAVREHSTLSKDEAALFESFDQTERKWLAQSKVIIGDQYYQRYLEMRSSNEKEKMAAYQEYHDYLRKKYGDTFTYNISEDQSVREKEINQKYLKELLALIGKEKFQQYISARDKINEENRRGNKEFIQVEF